MHFVYILKNLKDSNLYVGRTTDLKQRLLGHNKELVFSTEKRRPLKIIYAEISNNIKDAIHREKYLKNAWGKMYIKNRLKNDTI